MRRGLANTFLLGALLSFLAPPAFADMTAQQHYERGMVENTQSKFADAIADYNIAISMQPDFWKAYANRASAEYYSHNYQAALADINIAIPHLPPLKSLTDLKAQIEQGMKVASVRSQQAQMEAAFARIRGGGGPVQSTAAGQMTELANIVMRGGHKIPSNLIHPMQTSLIHPIGGAPDIPQTTANSPITATVTGAGSAPVSAVNSPITASDTVSQNVSSTVSSPVTATVNSAMTSTPVMTAQQYLARGEDRGHAGDWSGAIADFDECLKLQPKNGMAYIDRGSAKINSGNLQGALDDLNKGVDLLPDNATARELRDKLKAALNQAQQNINQANH